MFKMFYTLLFIVLLSSLSYAEEIVIRSVDLPGASADQEITYHPSLAEYERVRDEILARLRKREPSAMVNPSDGPWMRVETTAKIGFSYYGIGAASGKKKIRQITAAEEALYLFERKK